MATKNDPWAGRRRGVGRVGQSEVDAVRRLEHELAELVPRKGFALAPEFVGEEQSSHEERIPSADALGRADGEGAERGAFLRVESLADHAIARLDLTEQEIDGVDVRLENVCGRDMFERRQERGIVEELACTREEGLGKRLGTPLVQVMGHRAM